MKKNLTKISSLVLACTPFVALADVDLLDLTSTLLSKIVPILMTIAIVAFFWGLITYIRAAGGGNDAEKKQGKAIMIWGIVALFVMVSVWGLVSAVGTTLGIDSGSSAPTVELPSSN